MSTITRCCMGFVYSGRGPTAFRQTMAGSQLVIHSKFQQLYLYGHCQLLIWKISQTSHPQCLFYNTCRHWLALIQGSPRVHMSLASSVLELETSSYQSKGYSLSLSLSSSLHSSNHSNSILWLWTLGCICIVLHQFIQRMFHWVVPSKSTVLWQSTWLKIPPRFPSRLEIKWSWCQRMNQVWVCEVVPLLEIKMPFKTGHYVFESVATFHCMWS